MAEQIPRQLPDAIRALDAVDAYQRETDEELEKDAFMHFANLATSSARIRASAWTINRVKQLRDMLDKALDEAAAKAEQVAGDNPYAIQQAIDNVRRQMRQIAAAMEPPAEILDSEEFQALMDLLNPRMPKHEKSEYKKSSMMRGKVRSDVLNRQVNEAVLTADRRATNKRLAAAKKVGMPDAVQSNTATLMQLARMLRKKKKKKKAAVDDAAAVDEPEWELTIEDAEELAAAGMELMLMLREEFAPKWAPDQQPWFLNSADNEVFSIILGAIPKELFEETQAFGQMQDLRAGQEVFTLRAADKTTEAVGRKK